MEVYVIRHTPVAVPKDTCYGRSDVVLADSFPEDIKKYKVALPLDFDTVYSSPLTRCTSLAVELGYQNYIASPLLPELNFGDWENKKWSEIDQKELHEWFADFVNKRTPNGENLSDLFSRVASFFDIVRNEDHKKILVITHAAVIRCIYTYLLEIPLKNIFRIPVDFFEVLNFHLSPDGSSDRIIRMK